MVDDPSHHGLAQLQSDLGSAVYATIEDCEGEPRLVCASRKDERGAGRGNSFWVALQDTRWFVVTWAPRYYCCPPNVDIAQLCREWLAAADITQAAIDAVIRDRYQLVEVEEDFFLDYSDEH
jgi:hypothetical protein